jgi:hypothetical protein
MLPRGAVATDAFLAHGYAQIPANSAGYFSEKPAL